VNDDDAFDLAFDMGGPELSPGQTASPPAPPEHTGRLSAAIEQTGRQHAHEHTGRIPTRETTGRLTHVAPTPLHEVTGRQPGIALANAAPAPRSMTHGLDESIFDDLDAPPAAPLLRPVPPAPPPPPAPRPMPSGHAPAMSASVAAPNTPVRIGFTNARSFQIHYQLMLKQMRVYCTIAPFPQVGETRTLIVDLPDGLPPHVGPAVVEDYVGPPLVPVPGWVAVVLDPDGSVEARVHGAARKLGIP